VTAKPRWKAALGAGEPGANRAGAGGNYPYFKRGQGAFAQGRDGLTGQAYAGQACPRPFYRALGQKGPKRTYLVEVSKYR
jgi:hypothetical protein